MGRSCGPFASVSGGEFAAIALRELVHAFEICRK
jgi:hypothetical protein